MGTEKADKEGNAQKNKSCDFCPLHLLLCAPKCCCCGDTGRDSSTAQPWRWEELPGWAGRGGTGMGQGRDRTARPPPASAELSLSPRPGEELHLVEGTSCPRAELQIPLPGEHPGTLQELVLCRSTLPLGESLWLGKTTCQLPNGEAKTRGNR